MSVLVALELHYFRELLNWWHSPFNACLVYQAVKLNTSNHVGALNSIASVGSQYKKQLDGSHKVM